MRGARALWLIAALSLAYAGCATLGLQWSLVHGMASPVWPAAGVGLAALVLGGVRLWPGILLGYLLAHAINGPPYAAWVPVVLGLGTSLATVFAAIALRRAGFNRGFERLRDVPLFIAVTLASTLLAATIGTGALVAVMPAQGTTDILAMWMTWFLGDAAGVLVMAPLVLAWFHGRAPRAVAWWVQLAGCLALAAVLCWTVFLVGEGSRTFTFIAVVPLLWAASSLHLRGATLVALVVAAFGIWGTTLGAGPFSLIAPPLRFIELQLFIGVMASATLVLVAMVDERRAQHTLMLSEARLRLALEASNTGLWKLDLRTGAMRFSPECAGVTGFGARDIEHTRAGVSRLIHPEDQAAVRAAFWEAVDRRGLFESVFRLVHPDGRLVWIEARGRAMPGEDGDPGSMLGTIADITERKRDELRLAEQARLLDLSSDANIIRDMQGRVLYWNEGAVELYGYSREEAAGRIVPDLLDTGFPDSKARVDESLARTDRWTGELVDRCKDGRRVHVHARWVLNRDALGRPVSVLQTHTDVTAHRRAESNTRFLAEMDRRIAQAASADEIAGGALQLLGEHFDLLRCTLSDIDLEHGRIRTIHEWTNGAPRVSGAYEARDFFTSDLGRLLASGQAVAVSDLRTDPLTAAFAGNYSPYGTVALAAASYVVEGRLAGTLTVASGEPREWRSDETRLLREVVARLWPAIERTKAMAALRESEARFRQMADTVPMMIWVTEADGLCSYVSRRWLAFTGRRPEEELGTGWLDAVHPEDRAAAFGTFLEAGERQVAYSTEFRARRWDGEYRWMLASGRPRHGAGSEFLGYIGALMDITERREAEQALRDADHRKDEFLATLAHELRNPLAPIRTGLQVLNLAPDPDTAQRTRHMMERQLGHMVRLIDDLLEVSRITSGKVVLQRERMALQDAVTAALESARPLIESARHRLRIELPPTPLWVDADPTRLAQVLGNLLTNAAKYTPDGGEIGLAAAADGDEARVVVRDNGLGIPREALGEVFDMFAQVNRTLDRAQGGLGIGLALARRLIEMHGGRVDADSEGLGRGSTFTVRLPLAGAAPADAPDSPETVAAASCRVLVVDDNRDAAESLATMLELEGHACRVAACGPDGLRLAAEFDPHIVFLDIGMPGMNGHEVARRLRQGPRGAELFLVAASGWGSEADKRQAYEAGFDVHLTKPVGATTVLRVMAEAGERSAHPA